MMISVEIFHVTIIESKEKSAWNNTGQNDLIKKQVI